MVSPLVDWTAANWVAWRAGQKADHSVVHLAVSSAVKTAVQMAARKAVPTADCSATLMAAL